MESSNNLRNAAIRESIVTGVKNAPGAIGAGAMGAGVIGSLLRRKKDKEFKNKWKEIPEDDKKMIQYLREQAKNEKAHAAKAKWLNLIPLVSALGWGAYKGIKAYPQHKADIVDQFEQLKAMAEAMKNSSS